jgi:hypothetical protein
MGPTGLTEWTAAGSPRRLGSINPDEALCYNCRNQQVLGSIPATLVC